MGGAVQIGAHVAYDDARVAFEDAVAEASAQLGELGDAAAELRSATAAGETIVSADPAGLVDAASVERLAAVVADAQETADETAAAAGSALPDAADKPFWAWEVFAATEEVRAGREDAERLAAAFDDASEDAAAGAASVADAGTALLTAAAAAAPQFETAHVSARNLDVIALRRAAEQVSAAADDFSPSAADAYASLTAAATQVVASERAELAEKAGPLQPARLEVEAFARSLAPGVLLEFDWAPTVNGYGEGDSMGGYATWWYDDPGYATLEFSDSVARQWPSERSKALVAHEVGHAISVKCEGVYDDSTPESIEAWATAWAISMGFHDDANGTSVYGDPPQSLIEIAATCR